MKTFWEYVTHYLTPRHVIQYPIRVIQWVCDTEWSENWKSWPHCNGQWGCWMYITSRKPWCSCHCRWCKVARKIRRDGDVSP